MPPAINELFQIEFRFSQSDIQNFADLSGDTNAVHIDQRSPASIKFGGCIAHGLLTQAVFSKIFGTLLYADGNILVRIECEFLAPVRPDVEYIARTTVEEIFSNTHKVSFRTEVLSRESQQLCLTGKWILQNRKQFAGGKIEPRS